MSSYWCSKICHLHLRVLKFAFDWNWFWRKIYLHDCGEECFIFAQKTVLNKNRLRRLWKYYPSQHVQTFPFNKFVRVVRNLAPWFWYNCMRMSLCRNHIVQTSQLPFLCFVCRLSQKWLTIRKQCFEIYQQAVSCLVKYELIDIVNRMQIYA